MKEISIQDLQLNPVTLFGSDWALLTAGTEAGGYNTMTVGWGHIGAIWPKEGLKGSVGMPTVVVYVRPERYTKTFIDREPLFTLTALPESGKRALGLLGSRSGRDGDKVADAGLTPMFHDGTVSFAEASLTLVCRKLYHAPILESGFVDRSIVDKAYPDRSFHEFYVGEILKVYVAED